VLYVNTQEAETLKEWLPPDTVVVKPEELGTDAVVQGLEKNRMYERKELRDFLASVVDRRIFDQLKTLGNNRDNGYEPFIILEGQGFYDFETKKWYSLKAWFELHPERKMSFYEALTAFRAFGVGLVLTTDTADTALYLVYENEKLGKPREKKEYPERGGFRRDWDTAKKKEYLMEAFGPKVGKALNKEFFNLRGLVEDMFVVDAIDWKTPEEIVAMIAEVRLDSGRRIGTVKAKEIYEVLFT
jgi:ERCC4-type nuclease